MKEKLYGLLVRYDFDGGAMYKRILIFLFLLTSVLAFSATEYTVIFKNGKVLKGELISETAETIVLKDAQGLQYSLKKAVLDLEKMKAANTAPPAPEPAPVAETPAAPTPAAPAAPAAPSATGEKKEAKVYTAQDVEKLREKYGELATSQQSDLESAVLAGEVTPQNYYQYLQDGTSRVESVFEQIGSLIDGMTTAWEVNASTGKDPLTAFRTYRSGKAAAEIMQGIAAELSSLETVREGLSKPPQNYQEGFETFAGAIDGLNRYYESVRQYDGNPPVNVFRSRVADTESGIKSRIEQLKSLKPTVQPAPQVPEEEEEEGI